MGKRRRSRVLEFWRGLFGRAKANDDAPFEVNGSAGGHDVNKRKVVLRNTRGADDWRYLSASLSENGTLLIEGQDLGSGVEAHFGRGEREYEWAWTIRPQDVPKLALALGVKTEDVLEGLAAEFSGDAAAGLKLFLDAGSIPHEVWSRVGD